MPLTLDRSSNIHARAPTQTRYKLGARAVKLYAARPAVVLSSLATCTKKKRRRSDGARRRQINQMIVLSDTMCGAEPVGKTMAGTSLCHDTIAKSNVDAQQRPCKIEGEIENKIGAASGPTHTHQDATECVHVNLNPRSQTDTPVSNSRETDIQKRFAADTYPSHKGYRTVHIRLGATMDCITRFARCGTLSPSLSPLRTPRDFSSAPAPSSLPPTRSHTHPSAVGSADPL